MQGDLATITRLQPWTSSPISTRQIVASTVPDDVVADPVARLEVVRASSTDELVRSHVADPVCRRTGPLQDVGPRLLVARADPSQEPSAYACGLCDGHTGYTHRPARSLELQMSEHAETHEAVPRAPVADASVTFERFYDAERARLFQALVVITGNRSEAEDISQEAFLRTWERWERIEGSRIRPATSTAPR